MEKLALCSRILYDQNILDRMAILEKKLKEYERRDNSKTYPTYAKWIEDKNQMYNRLRTQIENNVQRNPIEYAMMGVMGLTSAQWVGIGNTIERELKTLSMNDKWSHIHAWHIMQNLSMLFDTLRDSGNWEDMYDRMDAEEIVELIYKNLYLQLENDVLLDFPKFKCVRCENLTKQIYTEDNICFECKYAHTINVQTEVTQT